jgi:hypothetical protein
MPVHTPEFTRRAAATHGADRGTIALLLDIVNAASNVAPDET